MKYIGIFYIVSSVLYISTLSAQELYFETKIYVRDSRGHTDSVTVALHPDLTSVFNPELGEEIITSPFDSVLDMRGVISVKESNNRYSKKIVSGLASPQQFSTKECYKKLERLNIIVSDK